MPVRRLGENELFSEAPELGVSLGTIFDQDLFNMPMIQKGMHNVRSRQLVLANYQEVRIRFPPDARQIHQWRIVERLTICRRILFRQRNVDVVSLDLHRIAAQGFRAGRLSTAPLLTSKAAPWSGTKSCSP